MARSNILFSEKALEKLQEAYQLLSFIEGELPATAKANLRQAQEWAASIINLLNKIMQE